MTPSPGSSTWTERGVAPVLLAATIAACLGGSPKDTASTPRAECPSAHVESYCAYEFGGRCPTYEEAATFTCDLYHFDITGMSTTPAGTYEGSTKTEGECRFPSVWCNHPTDPNAQTVFWFYDSGAVRALNVGWPGTDACPANLYLGDYPC